MRFTETKLAGAFLIELEPHRDERGFFARSFCEREFAAHGLPVRFPQSNLSRNRQRGTLRGMHYTVGPGRESKVVRCGRGAIWDVIVDLRPESPTRLQWFGVALSEEKGNALFVPWGFGHGFLTLEDDTDVWYQMGDFFVADDARGFRWNDPTFGIEWPAPPTTMSQRDATYADFDVNAGLDAPGQHPAGSPVAH